MKLRSIATVVCAVIVFSLEILAQVQGTWSTTKGNLPSPLESNIQVLLTKGNTATVGNVLVAGGTNGVTVLSTAQLYNPKTRVWTATGSLGTARYNFAAVVLPTGQVLVEGGMGPGSAILASAELYTPSTGSWTSAGAMSVARWGHTATLLKTGKVLVTGGCTSSSCTPLTAVSELYDPKTNTWTQTAGLNLARTSHTATLLPSGKVLVVGGSIGTNTSTKSCEIYDPTAKTWTTVANTSVPRNEHAAALLASGSVLVAGGTCGECAYSSAEIYNPVTNLWTATGNMTIGRFSHTATALANKTVLISGGGTYIGTTYKPNATTEIYDEPTGTFKATGSLNQSRMSHTASLLSSGQTIALGGVTSSGLSQTAEVYTPLTLTISPLSLSFGYKQIGVTSAAQTVTVTNVGNSAVAFTGVAAKGDFVQTNTCPSSSATLAAGASCSISVSFKPTVAGARKGSVVLTDKSLGSPTQTIALTGTGEKYALSFTPSPLTLPSVAPGSTSSATTTIINDGAGPVNLSTISITPANGPFTQTNGCPSQLQISQTCTIQVFFAPPDSVTYTGTLQVTDASTGNSYGLPLKGIGAN